ncbi:hypothetical protein [uncultured Bartonella sp.]|nr:hypothetical protein [uncultured Bartonella sp.]
MQSKRAIKVFFYRAAMLGQGALYRRLPAIANPALYGLCFSNG